MSQTTALVAVLLFVLAGKCSADTIVLKNGERVEGRIALRGPDEVRIETADGMRRFLTQAIQEIVDDPDLSPRAPELQGPVEPPVDLVPKPHPNCTECDAKGLRTCSNCGGLWQATRRPHPCKRCNGTGAANCPLCRSSGKAFCDGCGGDGKVRIINGYHSANGIRRPLFSDATCSVCSGAGKKTCVARHKDSKNEINCEACQGNGTVVRRAPCDKCKAGYVYCMSCDTLHRLVTERRVIRPFFEAANVAARERLDYVSNRSKTLSCIEAADRVQLWLTANSRSSNRETTLLRSHEAALSHWFRNLPGMLARNVRFFANDVPLEVCNSKNGEALLIKGIVPDLTVRGVHSDSVSRAREVAKAIATPFFYSLEQVLVNSPFDSFAVVVLYGKENFADIPDGRIQPEAFAIIVDADAARLLVRGEITEQAFYRRAEFFCADRDRGLAMGLIRTEFAP